MNLPEHFREGAPVRRNRATGRWFITIGQPGFNAPANNRDGYATKAAAEATTRRYWRAGRKDREAEAERLDRLARQDREVAEGTRIDIPPTGHDAR